MMDESIVQAVTEAVQEERIVETARALVDVSSPTLDAGAAADRLAEILDRDGFAVERVVADWPEASAVVTRVDSGRPGRTLQFDGHLDTVHLPFKASSVDDGVLRGSGASDMKGGVAAFVEAMRVLRALDLPAAGGVLMTAHDHHEGPWGDKRQLKALIREGYVGDPVMFPEYLATSLPLRGRGMAIFNVTFRRDGEPVHEVLRPQGLPDVNAAGADFLVSLRALDEALADRSDGPRRDSVFTGQIAGGEIYNQAPVTCLVSGTRRWVEPGSGSDAVSEVQTLANDIGERYGVTVEFDCAMQGDAFSVDEDSAIVQAFQASYAQVTGGRLPIGEKPFLDDGNVVSEFAGVPPLTHGPDAYGAHTVDEHVKIDELVRVARVYALTAVAFCTSVR